MKGLIKHPHLPLAVMMLALSACGYHWQSSPQELRAQPIWLSVTSSEPQAGQLLRQRFRPWLAHRQHRAKTQLTIRHCHTTFSWPPGSHDRFGTERNITTHLRCEYRWGKKTSWQHTHQDGSFTLSAHQSLWGNPLTQAERVRLYQQIRF